eukprot:TRINITY_DN5054_c0_g1_i1.p1 TRINITY_DN5054_c0_g1~~TRINITY_DN5054_c0_g1_i1.p1  ORF type:complete len:253 (-),score=11.19 TRINITY_DN5054_c0_g1_i1:6-764(-)
MENLMENLPEEIIQSVWRLLEVEDLARASQVSQLWYHQAYNPSFWRDLYFKRFPTFVADADFKQRVGDGWRTRFAYMKSYADSLKLNTLFIAPKIREYVEEVLISPSLIQKNQLFISPDVGPFNSLRNHLRSLKNNLFNVFSYDSIFISRWRATGPVPELKRYIAAAKAEGKKMLLMLHDMDNTNVRFPNNPIITNDRLTKEFIQFVNQNKEDIILFGYSKAIEDLTPPLIEMYARSGSQNPGEIIPFAEIY